MKNHLEELKNLYSVLREQTSDVLAVECCNHIANSEILFHSGSALPQQRTYWVYERRYKLQIKRQSNVVTGYEQLLRKLEYEQADILISSVDTKDAAYIIFLTTPGKQFVGILKSTNSNIAKAKELRSEYIRKGLEDSAECYYQMEFKEFE